MSELASELGLELSLEAVSSLAGVHHFVTLGVHHTVDVTEPLVSTVTGPPLLEMEAVAEGDVISLANWDSTLPAVVDWSV